ncbi:MAG: CapA family protein [Ardenticatenaceae bacterium]|nr:CapA family protein [Ardenticatenaceae bacterium]
MEWGGWWGRYGRLWFWAWFWLCGAAACQQRPAMVAVPTPMATAPPVPATVVVAEVAVTVTVSPDNAATLVPTAMPVRWRVGADGAVPAAVREAVAASALFEWGDGETADLQLTINEGEPVAEWVYAVVGAFPTIADGVTLADLQARWTAGELVVDETMAAFLAAEWGAVVSPLVVEDVRAVLWAERPSMGLIPFEELTPDLKVLAVDGVSPLAADFAAAGYPLTVGVGVRGEPTAVAQLQAFLPEVLTNRDAARLTRIAMTGVTALVRATAWQMETRGVLVPGTAVAPVLQTADIAHVSNEVAFSPDCPYPEPVGGTSFCSRDSYLALLTELGIDVVELTGNHVNDYGAANLVHSLDLYAAAGMVTFGGGRDLAAAQEPAVFVDHGNRIAFVGCNVVGPAYAWATSDQAGARPCDEGFYAQISQLKAEGYVVIATLQYQEYYHYEATAVQQEAFRAVAAAGATAVSGSQGHHAQGFEFYDGSFVHYGLGNLFFDQMDMMGTRQTFVDEYVVYDGRLLNVALWTGLIESWCCPREMTVEEREGVLTAVFQASGW